MTDPPRLSELPEGDPERFSELPEGDPARSLFGSLRDMTPPADLSARTLAGLGLLPPPAGPPASPPAPPPPPLAPSGASLLSGALKPLATSLALLSLAGGAAHVALAPSRPAVTASPALSARPRAAAITSAPPASASDGVPARDGAAALDGATASVASAPDRAPGVAPLASSSAAPPAPSSAAVAVLATASGEPARLASLTPPSPDLAGPAASPDRQPPSARSPERRDPVAERTGDAVPTDGPRAATTAPADELPAPLVAPVATPAAPARPRLDLDRELAALDLARSALAGGSPARALDAIAAYRAAFPAGQLGAEALLIEIEARMRTGDRATAVQLAQTFLARHPRSVLAARVRSLAGLPAAETNP